MTVDEMRDLLAAQIPPSDASGAGTTIFHLVSKAGLDKQTWLNFLETYMAPLSTLVAAGFIEVLFDLFQIGFAVGKLSATRQSQQASKIN